MRPDPRNHPSLWLITRDPTQTIATRPLAIQKSGTWYCYGWDLTKNICEVFGSNGYINTIYTYTPYGKVTSSGSTAQPLPWSNEYSNADLGTVILSLLIMADTVGQIKPYIDKSSESDYREAERVQIVTNAWWEGAKNTIQKRKKPNSQTNPNYYPKSGDTPEQVKYDYETIKQILGY